MTDTVIMSPEEVGKFAARDLIKRMAGDSDPARSRLIRSHEALRRELEEALRQRDEAASDSLRMEASACDLAEKLDGMRSDIRAAMEDTEAGKHYDALATLNLLVSDMRGHAMNGDTPLRERMADVNNEIFLALGRFDEALDLLSTWANEHLEDAGMVRMTRNLLRRCGRVDTGEEATP